MSANFVRGLGVLTSAAAVLTGCGGGGAKNPPPQRLAASTPHGLSYTLEVTQSGQVQCVTSNFRTALPTGQPILDGSHLCGSPDQPGHAMLIQTPTSRDSMLTDVTLAACNTVRGGPAHSSLQPLVSHCTSGTPRFRVTILPQATRLAIVGVLKVPVINFPRHRCPTGICVTPLA